MPDCIQINGLEVRAFIGVPNSERRRKQRLLVSVEMETAPTRPAGRADALAKTIDYQAAAERIRATVCARPRKLLETLAEDVADALLRSHGGNGRLRRVTVEVEKFALPGARSTAVRIQRRNRSAKR